MEWQVKEWGEVEVGQSTAHNEMSLCNMSGRKGATKVENGWNQAGGKEAGHVEGCACCNFGSMFCRRFFQNKGFLLMNAGGSRGSG